MSYDEFKIKYNGHGIDFDGFYGFQCMDLTEQYNREVVGANKIGGNAKDAVTNYDHTKYDYVVNTPTGVPLKGDIVIWGAMPGNAYGHIAVFDSGNVNSFVSFDQNWPVGSVCHLQSHSYSYVLGWLHPKIQLSPDEQKLIKIRSILDSSTTATDKLAQIKQIVG